MDRREMHYSVMPKMSIKMQTEKEHDRSTMTLNSITIEIDMHSFQENISRLRRDYMHKHAHEPNVLYCSPMGYMKLRTYFRLQGAGAHVYGMKCTIVPCLSEEFVVYDDAHEDYMYMLGGEK